MLSQLITNFYPWWASWTKGLLCAYVASYLLIYAAIYDLDFLLLFYPTSKTKTHRPSHTPLSTQWGVIRGHCWKFLQVWLYESSCTVIAGYQLDPHLLHWKIDNVTPYTESSVHTHIFWTFHRTTNNITDEFLFRASPRRKISYAIYFMFAISCSTWAFILLLFIYAL